MSCWNLGDLYESPCCADFARDKASVELLVKDFSSKYKTAVLSNNLEEKIIGYEKIATLLHKIDMYAYLYSRTRLDDQEAMSFYQGISEWKNNLASGIVFFTTGIAQMKDEHKREYLGSRYLPWIEECMRYRDHTLPVQAEEALARKQTTSRLLWIRQFDEILARMDFDFNGDIKNLSEILEIANYSEVEEERAQASKILGSRLESEGFYLKTIYNSIILDAQIDCELRHYPLPEEPMHLYNNINKKSVDCLSRAVIDGYKRTSNKYYQIKAKLLGKEKLEYWDKNTPVRFSKVMEKRFTYEEASAIVLDIFSQFSAEFGKIAGDFVSRNWIDAYPKKGKESGAFSYPGTQDTPPYILLNFFGTKRDISTMAHEIGHGIHQTLSAKNGILLAETPLTLSEIASIFGEKLLFEHFLKQAQTPLEKIDLICSKLDDTVSSVMRQIAFFEFEREVHEKRKQEELSKEAISRVWMSKLAEYLGPSVHLDDSVSMYWAYISHFFHTPFYVYVYAFAEIFVNAIYECYKNGLENFVEKYSYMLSRGGIDRYDVATRPFGLDPLAEGFWENGNAVIASQVEYLEELCASALS